MFIVVITLISIVNIKKFINFRKFLVNSYTKLLCSMNQFK